MEIFCLKKFVIQKSTLLLYSILFCARVQSNHILPNWSSTVQVFEYKGAGDRIPVPYPKQKAKHNNKYASNIILTALSRHC